MPVLQTLREDLAHVLPNYRENNSKLGHPKVYQLNSPSIFTSHQRVMDLTLTPCLTTGHKSL